MTFVPTYSARFELPIIENVLAIIVRDFKEGLDYFYLDTPSYTTRYGVANGVGATGEDLPDFVERSIGTEQGLNFPILVLGPRSNQIEKAADDSHLIEPIIIELKIGVTASSANDAMKKIMKYVRVMDAVLRTATYADYFTGFTTGASQPFGLSVDVTHEYGPLGADEKRTIYFKPASLDLRLTFNER